MAPMSSVRNTPHSRNTVGGQTAELLARDADDARGQLLAGKVAPLRIAQAFGRQLAHGLA